MFVEITMIYIALKPAWAGGMFVEITMIYIALKPAWAGDMFVEKMSIIPNQISRRAG